MKTLPIHDWVIEGLRLGLEATQIAEDLSVTEEFVYTVGIEAGFKMDSNSERIAELVRQGKTDREIAAELGLNTCTVVKSRMRQGLKANHKPTRKDEIIKRHLAGERQCDIACAFGIAVPYICRVVNDYKREQREKEKATFPSTLIN